MNTNNLSMIWQPAWKILILDFVASRLKLLAHVEGVPIGQMNKRYAAYMQEQTEQDRMFSGSGIVCR